MQVIVHGMISRKSCIRRRTSLENENNLSESKEPQVESLVEEEYKAPVISEKKAPRLFNQGDKYQK